MTTCEITSPAPNNTLLVMLFVASGRVCRWRTYAAHIVPEEGEEEEKQDEEGREERTIKMRKGKAGSIMPSLEAASFPLLCSMCSAAGP